MITRTSQASQYECAEKDYEEMSNVREVSDQDICEWPIISTKDFEKCLDIKTLYCLENQMLISLHLSHKIVVYGRKFLFMQKEVPSSPFHI